MMGGGTLAADFDGVLHLYSRGWHDGTIYDPPVPGALDGLRTLMETHSVFIFTAREPEQVMPWLEGYGFDVTIDERCGRCLGTGGLQDQDLELFCRVCNGSGLLRFWNERRQLLVTNRKLPASYYLDDRAVRFTSWGQALRDLIPDQASQARHQRVEQALLEAWPDLDGVFVEQLVEVAVRAMGGGVDV